MNMDRESLLLMARDTELAALQRSMAYEAALPAWKVRILRTFNIGAEYHARQIERIDRELGGQGPRAA